MSNSMRDEWPTNPPEPTDLYPPNQNSELPVQRCAHCLDLVDRTVDEMLPYYKHIRNCPEVEETSDVWARGLDFSIVIPEQTGYVWRHQTGGFACNQVAIQGMLLPIGAVKELNIGPDYKTPDLDGKFEAFDDPEKAKQRYITGLRIDHTSEYGSIDLGSKLVSERLAGVYENDEDVRDEMRETRDARLQAIWERIDSELPFTYNRVAAPYGYPVTQEGLRWINITGHQESDELFQEDWVDTLINHSEPVALFYPNCD